MVHQGKDTYDFKLFRNGKKHVIGMFNEVISLASSVKDAVEGGSSREMVTELCRKAGEWHNFCFKLGFRFADTDLQHGTKDFSRNRSSCENRF